MYLDDKQKYLVRDMWIRIQHMIHTIDTFSVDYDWEPIYDFAFNTMNQTLRKYNIRVDWCDLDTTYREDVEMYLYGVRELMEQNDIPTEVHW